MNTPIAANYTAESGHWYDQSGKPAYTIIGKNGGERPTTLRDARALGLVPSVTTIMGMAAKPALENWKIDQAIMAALTLPRLPDEPLDAFMARAKLDSKEQAKKAAQRGTELHGAIERHYIGTAESEIGFNVQLWLDALFPNRIWTAEDSFKSPLGYGGKIDLYSGDIFVDFKGKENVAGSEAAKMIYDEHGMQLSAYAQGMGVAKPTRVSMFFDRNTLEVKGHVWEPESHAKHCAMFNSLLSYWQHSKGYFPVVGGK